MNCGNPSFSNIEISVQNRIISWIDRDTPGTTSNNDVIFEGFPSKQIRQANSLI